MTTIKVTDMAEDTAPTSDDMLMVVDNPGGSPVSKKVQIGNIHKGMTGASTTVAGVIEIATGAEVTTGTDDTRATSPKSLADANVRPVTSQFWLGAGGIQPHSSSGCAYPAVLETATNKQQYKYCAYDPTSIERGSISFALPSDYKSGTTITAKFYWTHPATTTNFGVHWLCRAEAMGDAQALDVTPSASTGGVDTGGTTSYLYISPETSAITIVKASGTVTAGDIICFTISRYASDTGDTLAVDAYLIGVMISYTRA